MIDKDSSIVTQVAAKIAGDIVNSDTPLETALSDFSTAFAYVKSELFEALAIDLTVAAFNATVVSSAPASNTYQAPSAPTGELKVQGDQYGPLPTWLIDACRKSGVGKVWDNRGGDNGVLNDDGTPKNKRPWFKQADQAKGAEPIAYWPPKAGK